MSRGDSAVVRLRVDEADRCPICGEANGCAMARGEASSPEACWCVGARVPADLLDHLASEVGPNRCLCRACLSARAAECSAEARSR